MSPRLLRLLAGALAGLAALWTLGELRSRKTPGPEPLWAEAASARRLTLSKAGQTVTLERDGPDWRLARPFEFPADSAAMAAWLGTLARVRLSAPLGSDPARHEAFAVTESSGLRLQAWAPPPLDQPPGEKPALDILVGRQGADYDSVFVRRNGELAVYEARGLARHEVDREAGAWADRRLCDLPEASVAAVELRAKGQPPVRLERAESGWRLAGSKGPLPAALASSHVQPILAALAKLEAEGVAPEAGRSSAAKAAPDKPELVVLVHHRPLGGTEQTLTLSAGAREADYKHPLRSSARPGFVYSIAGWKLDPFRRRASDFAPTPPGRYPSTPGR